MPVHVPKPVAVMVKVELPGAVGVPVIAPVVLFNDKPAGNVPAVTAKLYVVPAGVALTVWLYAVPAVPLGKVVGLSVIVGHTTVMV